VPTKKKGLGSAGGLGKRLQALGLAESHIDDKQQVVLDIKIENIVPNERQARKKFDADALSALAASIQQHGIVQPLVVQPVPGSADKYEIIAGERRWRAAKQCGLTVVPVIIRDYAAHEAAEISLIENLQREDLNAMEEAGAYAQLIEEFGLTQEEAAEKVGKSRSHVANMLRLLHLPQAIQQLVIDGVLSMGQARPLLQITDQKQQLEMAARIADQGLSARQVEAWVRSVLEKKDEPPKEKTEPDAYLESLADRMKMHLGTAVSIRLAQGKKSRGRIEISFTSEAEFERLLEMLTEEGNESGPAEKMPPFSL
jgi:ParB family chromosome partitioning protein